MRTEAFATLHFTANWIQMVSVSAGIFLHAAGRPVDWCPSIIHVTIIQNLAITQQRFVLSLIRLLSHRTWVCCYSYATLIHWTVRPQKAPLNTPPLYCHKPGEFMLYLCCLQRILSVLFCSAELTPTPPGPPSTDNVTSHWLCPR